MREMAFKNLDVLTFKLERLLLHASLDPPTRQILESAHDDVKSVAAIVSRMQWRGLLRLEGEIDNEAYKLLSKFESISSPKELKKCTMGKSNKIRSISKLEDSMRSRFSTDRIGEELSTDGLSEAVQALVEMAKKMEKDYADALYNQYSSLDQTIQAIEGEEESDDEVEMVGLSGEYEELKEKLFEGSFFQVLPVVGMAGIGKSTLCRKVFGDVDVVKRFELRVWVRIGRGCELEHIPRRILAEMGMECSSCLAQVLKGKRYLIVLDNVWERNAVYRLHSLFGDVRGDNGSRVIVTTRLQQGDVDHMEIRLMNKDESWELLRLRVFGSHPFPVLLEEPGKKIAENCDGLPLTIVRVADKLGNPPKLDYWIQVAVKKNHQIFKDVYYEISKLLRPSYDYLPPLLQLCFLYMAVFPQNFEVTRSKLLTLWDIDGFLVRNFQIDAILCLEELVSNSVAMIYAKSTGATSSVGVKEIKRCGLHSSFWYLAVREARKIKFCQVLNTIDDGLDKEILMGQQRLAFHNNILFCIKC